MEMNFTKKIIASFAVCMTLIAATHAATFTAIASGSWSSASTWSGGNVPGTNIIHDDVIIGSGFVVDLDQDVTIGKDLVVAGSLSIAGTLSSATAGRTLTFTEGSLMGAGNIMVSRVKFNMAATLAFTGTIVTDEMENWMSLVSAAQIKATRTARMVGGLTIATGGKFELGNDATLIIEGGSILATGSGSLLFSSSYSVSYQGASSTSGSELSGAGLKNVTIDVGSGKNVKFGSDAGINGTLSLTSGEMDLNGHHLVLKGDLAAAGSGMIKSTDQSDIMVQGAGTLTGALRFASNGNTVRHFTINRTGSGSKTVTMASDLYIKGMLMLTSGQMNTDSFMLTIMNGGSIMGGDNNNYIITGLMGRLAVYHTSGGSYITYPVGTSQRYIPAAIRLVSGGSGMVRVNVINEVYAQGTSGADWGATQKVVKGTWNITSEMSANLNLDMKLMWAAAAEANAFDRTKAYISHYTAGSWDITASASATAEAGGMFSLTRTGVTSLSPFSVQQGSATGIATIDAASGVLVYPNPAIDFIMISNAENATVEIMNALGQVVQTTKIEGSAPVNVSGIKHGNYSIKISGEGSSTIKKFIKL